MSFRPERTPDKTKDLAARRERDVANEEEQLTVLSTMVLRYQEQDARLQEMDSDGDGPVDDAVDVATLDPIAYGIFSHTNTLYAFGDGPRPGAGFPLDHQQQDARMNEQADSPPEGLDLPLAALGLGEGIDFDLIESESILAGGGGMSQSDAGGQQPGEGFGARPREPRRVTLPPSTMAAQPTLAGITPRDPPKTTGMTVPAEHSGNHAQAANNPTSESAVSPPRVVPKTSETAVSLGTGSPLRSVAMSGSATITTSSTKTTPSTSASLSSSAFTIHGRSRDRLRSVSEGDPSSNPLGSLTGTRDELSRLKMLVSARTQSLSQDLMAVLDRLRGSSGPRTGWADDELRQLLSQMEKLESNIWIKMVLVEGAASQKKRMDRWREWKERQRARVRLIKEKSWELQQARPSSLDATVPRKATGHVEKVKLPTFSGKQEDFAEFRCQFRELCRGEGYTAILELAQLKMKLPREALATIAGLQCPELAWKRLEEMYGNRELSILSALKNLREFKSSKSAAHEQVIDLAMAVQKCHTELKNIDAVNELLGDRESLACIVQSLPVNIRDKWYDRKAPDDTLKRGEFLLAWIEEQRQTAIRVRLDALAAKLRAPPNVSGRNANQSESTDQGLMSSALHAQCSDKVNDANATVDPPPRTKPKLGEGGVGARIEVKTVQDAQAVTEKRKLSLETRKIDKCPVCGQVHTYERTWSKLQPPVKAKLLSTHLTSCPEFLALSADAKLAAVLGNAACLVCAAWDHAVHKFPGGQLAKDPKCSRKVDGTTCGGQHGKWYHEGAESGASHSVVAEAASYGSGLYEVYSALFTSSSSQEVDKSSVKGMILVDPGSDTNFVRNDFAKSLGLTGEPCEFRLKVVDLEARPIRTTRYVVEIEDKTGARHSVRAMGLDTITILPPDPDLSPISGLVQGYPPEVLQRPQGDVDLLLGLRDSYLHGCTVQQWGNLRLLESPLGCGWALRGTHPDLAKPTTSMPAYAIQNADREPGPRGVRDDGKLGGLGHAALGRSNRTALGSPSPPLLHEVKLSGPVAGGLSVVRLRQEGKLVLQHEVKLCGSGTGGGVDVKSASTRASQVTVDPAPPILQSGGSSANCQSHSPLKDLGGLGGLGHAALGRSNRTALGSPSPPLLHEVKLSGPVAGGPDVVRLRQEGKLALQHEVKLFGPVAGGLSVVRLRQEGKLVLQHEVKLCGSGTGGGVDVKSASTRASQVTVDPAPPILQLGGSSANCQSHSPLEDQVSEEIFTRREPKREEIFTRREPKREEIFTRREPKREEIFTRREPKREEIFTRREPRWEETLSQHESYPGLVDPPPPHIVWSLRPGLQKIPY